MLGGRRKKRPRAIDPYLGYYPEAESELEPSSEANAGGMKRRRVEETSIVEAESDVAARADMLRHGSDAHTSVLQDGDDEGDEPGPARSRHARAVRQQRRAESDDRQSGSGELSDTAANFYDAVPGSSARAKEQAQADNSIARRTRSHTQPKPKPVARTCASTSKHTLDGSEDEESAASSDEQVKQSKRMRKPTTQRVPLVDRLLAKAAATNVRVDTQLEEVGMRRVPALKMTDGPLRRPNTVQHTQRTVTQRTSRSRLELIDYEFSGPSRAKDKGKEKEKEKAQEEQSSKRRVALSMLRQPVVPKVFAPMPKQNFMRPRPLGKSRVGGVRRTAATSQVPQLVFKPLKMTTDVKAFEDAMALRHPARKKLRTGDTTASASKQTRGIPPLRVAVQAVPKIRPAPLEPSAEPGYLDPDFDANVNDWGPPVGEDFELRPGANDAGPISPLHQDEPDLFAFDAVPQDQSKRRSLPPSSRPPSSELDSESPKAQSQREPKPRPSQRKASEPGPSQRGPSQHASEPDPSIQPQRQPVEYEYMDMDVDMDMNLDDDFPFPVYYQQPQPQPQPQQSQHSHSGPHLHHQSSRHPQPLQQPIYSTHSQSYLEHGYERGPHQQPNTSDDLELPEGVTVFVPDTPPGAARRAVYCLPQNLKEDGIFVPPTLDGAPSSSQNLPTPSPPTPRQLPYAEPNVHIHLDDAPRRHHDLELASDPPQPQPHTLDLASSDTEGEVLVPGTSEYDVPASYVYDSAMERTGYEFGSSMWTPLPSGVEVLVPGTEKVLAMDTPLKRTRGMGRPKGWVEKAREESREQGSPAPAKVAQLAGKDMRVQPPPVLPPPPPTKARLAPPVVLRAAPPVPGPSRQQPLPLNAVRTPPSPATFFDKPPSPVSFFAGPPSPVSFFDNKPPSPVSFFDPAAVSPVTAMKAKTKPRTSGPAFFIDPDLVRAVERDNANAKGKDKGKGKARAIAAPLLPSIQPVQTKGSNPTSKSDSEPRRMLTLLEMSEAYLEHASVNAPLVKQAERAERREEKRMAKRK